MQKLEPMLAKLVEFASKYKLGRMILKILTREMVAYLICGVLTAIIGTGSYALFTSSYIDLGTVGANVISFILAVTFAFFVNKKYVFLSNCWDAKHVITEFGTFVLGRLATFAGETLLLYILIDKLGYSNLWCKLFAQVLVVISNYVISKLIIFKKPKEC
jgi:putative flippase GtrA